MPESDARSVHLTCHAKRVATKAPEALLPGGGVAASELVLGFDAKNFQC